MQLSLAVSDLDKRLANLISIGTVSEVDYASSRAKATTGTAITGWLPWLTRRAGSDIDYWAPEIGEQVLVLAPGGQLDQAVILPALYQSASAATDDRPSVRRVRQADGADMSYDRDAHTLRISLPSGATIEIIADGGLSIVGDTNIIGKLHTTDNISSDRDIIDSVRSMQADRDIYNGHDHPHGDPITGTTNQQM